MLILKLGGAAITHKDKANTPNTLAIQKIARVLAEVPQALVLVHGAGSYGHILAEEHGLHKGYVEESQRAGYLKLPLDLLDLNRILLETLQEAGVPTMTFHPASLCLTKRGRISRFFLEPIRQALDFGFVPLLYGDCVWDESQTFSILSGDQLVVHLANALGATRVAFGTNVNGVLDEDGKVIPRYSFQNSAEVGQSASPDVTGGMQGKLREIQALRGQAAHIFNLNNSDHLRAILNDEDGAGTVIKA